MEKLANPHISQGLRSLDSTSVKEKSKIAAFFKMFLCMVLSVGALSGCASITRMQNSVEQMTYYMGVVASSMPQMAFSTKRMADTAEGLQQKSEGIMSEFQKKGVSTEKAVQNYAQTFIDNDRAIIKNLQGIKEELAQLKQPQSQTKSSDITPKNQERVNEIIMERIGKLENQIQTLSFKMNKTDTSGTNPKR